MEEIRLDIKNQIAKTDKAFSNYLGKLYLDGLLDEDIECLEILLKKATKSFKAFRIISIIFSVILFVFFVLAISDIGTFGHIRMNINLLAVILSIMAMMITSFRNYKIKVNLENKIYLLELLDKIEKQ